MYKYILVMVFGVFISSLSQVLLKKSAEKKYKNHLLEYLNPFVICAYLIFFGATFCSIYAYKKVPLSIGTVLESTSYIYVSIFGLIFFKEKINKKKIVGLVLIIIGATMYATLG